LQWSHQRRQRDGPLWLAARGDSLDEVGVVIGRLLRTVFFADYFVNPVFRREILRVLNRGEATNALKRLIYTGRVAGHQAMSQDEMQAVVDALSLRSCEPLTGRLEPP
jgi:TnpA family transposase